MTKVTRVTWGTRVKKVTKMTWVSSVTRVTWGTTVKRVTKVTWVTWND